MEQSREEQLTSLLRNLRALYDGSKTSPEDVDLFELIQATAELCKAKYGDTIIVFRAEITEEALAVRRFVEQTMVPRLLREIAACYDQPETALELLQTHLDGTSTIKFDDGITLDSVAGVHKRQMAAHAYRTEKGASHNVSILQSFLKGGTGSVCGGGGRRVPPEDNLDWIERRVDRQGQNRGRYGKWRTDDSET